VWFSPLGETALVIRLAGDTAAGDAGTIDAVRTAVVRLGAARIPGVIDVAAASATVTVVFDPLRTDPATLRAHAETALAASPAAALPAPRCLTLPVCYGGVHGPDLDAVAAHAGLAVDEVIRRHAGAVYRVAMIGFLPGFPYLVGLPAELAMPRLADPRHRVAAGSVGIAGERSGIYPRASPGGWRIIGRTPLPLFDPSSAPPARLSAGDIVRFEPIDAEGFARQAEGKR